MVTVSADRHPQVLTPRYLLRSTLAERIISRMPRGTFLEVGCGTGEFLQRLAARGLSGVGLEISPTVFALAAENTGHLAPEITLATTLDEVKPASFDYLMAFEVLQYIDDEVGSLRTWRNRLRAGGKLVATVPARRDMWSSFDPAVGHLRRYDRADLAELLKASGFTLERVISFGFPMRLLTRRMRSRWENGRDLEMRSEPDHDKALQSPLYAEVGVSRGKILMSAATRFAAFVFYWLGLPFGRLDLGDGYLVVARRSAEP